LIKYGLIRQWALATALAGNGRRGGLSTWTPRGGRR